MKRMRTLPKFESEAQEARWVFQNQDALADAVEFGKGPGLKVEEIVARSRAKAQPGRGVRHSAKSNRRGGV